TSLRYGFDNDRDYILPIYQRFRIIYFPTALVIHAIMFYLLLFHAKSWARAIRLGYLLNQCQMLAHDVWTFLFRPYTLLPYPINFCWGFACTAIGGFNAMTIETAFMVHSICLLQLMLIIMHQQIMPPKSRFIFSRTSLVILVLGIYATLSLNIGATFLAGTDSLNKTEILQV
ncbi:hypothetical protein PMAYCL1PPCAC_15133, partial [Pristionchus mayeri]